MAILGIQCRAARGLIDMGQLELAEAASVSRGTIVDFESGKREPMPNNVRAIQSALEDRGVIFIEGNGEGPGVRLRKSEKGNDASR